MDDYIEMDKKDKKGKRAIEEVCMRINEKRINMEISNTLESLNTIEREKNKLASIIHEGIYTVINELKEEPIIEEILELPRVRNNVVDNFTEVLVALAMRIVGYFYGVLALARLHLIMYPCYWPSRYRHEVQIPLEVLDEEVLRKLSDVAYELVSYIEAPLFKNYNTSFITR